MNNDSYLDEIEPIIRKYFHFGQLIIFSNKLAKDIADRITTSVAIGLAKGNTNKARQYDYMVNTALSAIIKRAIKFGDLIFNPEEPTRDIMKQIYKAIANKELFID